MVGQVVVAAGAAVAGALAGKIFGAGGKGAKGDPVFSVAAAANYDHESEIEKYAHLAQIYPEARPAAKVLLRVLTSTESSWRHCDVASGRLANSSLPARTAVTQAACCSKCKGLSTRSTRCRLLLRTHPRIVPSQSISLAIGSKKFFFMPSFIMPSFR